MLGDMIAALSNFMYTYLLVILLVAAGLFFTVRNRFPQLRLLKESIRVVVERPEKEGSVSSFQALMVSTASRVGTGNIIGVSVAICVGGYGAVFWMWLIALLGGATAFTESTLAQIYKRRNPETGESYGGPAYYIEAALHSKPLAVLFALSLIATYAGGFNMLCSYNLQSTFSGYGFYNPELTPWIIGGVVALLTGYCVMGGGKRIIAFASTLVPIMGGLYVLVALVVIIMNLGLIPQVFGRIFAGAFDFQAIFGGFTGSCIMQGIKRGLFSNESGMGSAPIAAAAAQTRNPVRQALVSSTGTFWDTVVVCLMTGLVLVTTIMKNPNINADEVSDGGVLTSLAFGQIPVLGPLILTLGIICFAYSTILGWAYYGERCVEYFAGRFGKGVLIGYRLLYVAVAAIAPVVALDLIWLIADTLNAFMAIPNLIAVLLLSNVIVKETKEYINDLDKKDETPVPVVKTKSGSVN